MRYQFGATTGIQFGNIKKEEEKSGGAFVPVFRVSEIAAVGLVGKKKPFCDSDFPVAGVRFFFVSERLILIVDGFLNTPLELLYFFRTAGVYF